MVAAIPRKQFEEWGGLDLRSNDKSRQPRFASEIRNVRPLLNNSWGLRNGVKGKAPSKGGIGTKSFVYVDTDGNRQEELIALDQEAWKKSIGTITITYSGAGTSAVFYLTPSSDVDDAEYVCQLLVDDVVVFSQSLGTGINESSPYSVASLVSAIDALADFACVSTGTVTGPAAFLPNTVEAIGAGLTVNFSYWTQIYCPTSLPFDTAFAALNEDNFEIASLFNHANRFWIATGYNKLYKYDGVSIYAAGMPSATAYSNAATGLGTVPAGTYECFITYEQVDALGNSVEGNASNFNSVTTSGANLIRHTLPNIQVSSEFLTSCAIVNGNQVGVTTITVDNTNTLQVGQTAYFLDGVSASYVERKITARTSTSITIQGAAVNVLDNAVISANLRINIWRPILGGDIAYLVASIPNDSIGASTQTYDDNVADATLLAGFEYEFPIEGHDEPPENLRYLTAYQNLLIGAMPSTDEVSHSDVDGPEYWPNNFRIRSKSNEPISGVGANKEIAVVFKRNETHIIQGNLSNQNYRQELLGDAIGCDSHHSIIDVEGSLWFYSKSHGCRRIQSTKEVSEVGYRIFPATAEKALFSENTFVHKRTIAIKYEDLQLVLLFIPVEVDSGSTKYPSGESVIFVADYSNQFQVDNVYDEVGRLKDQFPKVRWYKWDSFNIAGGATFFDDELVFTERRFNENTLALEFPLSVYSETVSVYDFCDHATPIPLVYGSGWDDLETPDMFKKWIECWVYSFPTTLASAFTLTCELETNFSEGVVVASKELSFNDAGGSGGWGLDAWSEDPWGAPGEQRKSFPFRPNRARSARLVFRGDIYLEFPVISGWDIKVVPVYSDPVAKES